MLGLYFVENCTCTQGNDFDKNIQTEKKYTAKTTDINLKILIIFFFFSNIRSKPKPKPK